MMTKVNNEDEAKRYGQQDNGVMNLRKVPNMVAGPEVEQIGPNWGTSAYNGEHVEEMIADGH